jgi:hypothetical protein
MVRDDMGEPKPNTGSIENPEGQVEALNPTFQKPTIICIGEYPIKILLRGPLARKDEPFPIFIDKFSRDIAEWGQSRLSEDNILGLDLNIDTHFWFQVLSHIENDDGFIARLRDKRVYKGTVIVSSLWDGLGSGLLPALLSRFKEWTTDTVVVGVLPSKMQVSDVHFNALSSIGLCVSKGSSSLLLLDRDQLESYVGVDRGGSMLKGNEFLNYLLELVAAKETFAQELSELSRAFDVKIYTVMSAVGASLSMYGSFKNILDSAMSTALLKCDLSTASVVYVLLRLPLQLKEKLSRGTIELEIAEWFKEKASLQSIFISEPFYAEASNDRIDAVMFVGGFEVTKMFASMEKKVRAIKSLMVKKGSVKEDEWRAIVKSLGVD